MPSISYQSCDCLAIALGGLIGRLITSAEAHALSLHVAGERPYYTSFRQAGREVGSGDYFVDFL